jgi:mRNA interferase RelE/StbE
MNLNLSRRSHQFLNDLQPKYYKQVASKLLHLAKDPRPNDCRHLCGHPGYFRVTAGEYRIIYFTTNDVVHISVINTRNDDAVYKELERVT